MFVLFKKIVPSIALAVLLKIYIEVVLYCYAQHTYFNNVFASVYMHVIFTFLTYKIYTQDEDNLPMGATNCKPWILEKIELPK